MTGIDRPRGPRASTAIPAIAVGALAFGALAIGALAIARLAIRELAVKKARFHAVEIDELTVRRLRVIEDGRNQTETKTGSP